MKIHLWHYKTGVAAFVGAPTIHVCAPTERAALAGLHAAVLAQSSGIVSAKQLADAEIDRRDFKDEDGPFPDVSTP